MENQEKKKVPGDNNDIDLGTILHLIGKGFTSIGLFIRQLFMGIINGILFALIFLKRRMWWIIGSLLIGFGWGTYQDHKAGARYYSAMTARFNFGSSRALYNTIEYLNNLIVEDRYNDLSKMLSISKAEAATLKYFDVDPIADEKEVSELYGKQFLAYNRSYQLRTDTFWTKTLPYKDFKASLTKYDFPLQEIMAVSTQIDIFPKIQQGIINAIAANGDLQKDLEIRRKMQKDDEGTIISSLQGLDTLRIVYNERLRRPDRAEGTATSVNVLDKASLTPNPELELFDKIMQLKDELKLSRENEIDSRDIVQVYASFSHVGKRSNILKQSAVTTSLQALMLLFIIFLIVEFYRVINYYEKKQKAN